jgi:diguanylate cyclase (GGDEF)-like protein
VKSQTLLSDVAHQHVNSPHSYLLVEDDDGCAVGVVGMEDIHRRLNSANILERRRWMNMPVEAALNGRLTSQPDLLPRAGTKAVENSFPCTAISSEGRLVALLTENDVMVSWKSIEQVLRDAQNDHVTNLPTRSAFEVQLRAECSRASRSHHSVGVILIDVDFFKQINDQFGHPAGDAVLSAVGRTLRNTFRSYDLVARYGGDEFAVLCCGCHPGEIDVTIQRIRKAMQKLQNDLTLPRPVPTLSIGACVAHDLDQIESPEQIIEAADECLYFAKRDGRNRSFTTELGVESVVSC